MKTHQISNREEGRCPFCHHTLRIGGKSQYSPTSYDWLTHMELLKCTRVCHSCGCTFLAAYGYKFYNSRVIEPGRDSTILTQEEDKTETTIAKDISVTVKEDTIEEKKEEKEEPIPPAPVSDVPVEDKIALTITSPWLGG